MNRSNNLSSSQKRSKAKNDYAKGAYLLILRVASAKHVNVGKLGTVAFARGFYVYVGSAMGAAGFKRVVRHLDVSAGRRKMLKWHVDYLLTGSEVVETIEIGTQERIECRIANCLAKNPSLVAVKGFGSSDCRCRSHLFFSRRLSDLENAKNGLVNHLCLKKKGTSALAEVCGESHSKREALANEALANAIRYTL